MVKNNKKIFSSFADFMQTSIIPILDRIEDRLNTMIIRIDKHDDKLEMHERKLFDHDERIGSLEKIAAP